MLEAKRTVVEGQLPQYQFIKTETITLKNGADGEVETPLEINGKTTYSQYDLDQEKLRIADVRKLCDAQDQLATMMQEAIDKAEEEFAQAN